MDEVEEMSWPPRDPESLTLMEKVSSDSTPVERNFNCVNDKLCRFLQIVLLTENIPSHKLAILLWHYK